MKFFKPQVQLVRETVLDQPDRYYMHVVTFCSHTNYRANGYSVDASHLDQGVYLVKVNLIQDTSIPDFMYITPIVHTLDLGSIAFPGGEGWFDVQVLGAVVDAGSGGSRDAVNPPTTTTKTGGSGTVSTSDADDKSKPLDASWLS